MDKIVESPDQKVRIELEDQVGTSHDPARIFIYYEENLLVEINSTTDYKMGADGGYYPCAIFEII